MDRPARVIVWLLGLVLAGLLLRLAATGDLAGPARRLARRAAGLVRPPRARRRRHRPRAPRRRAGGLVPADRLGAARCVHGVPRALGGHRAADAITTPAVRCLVLGRPRPRAGRRLLRQRTGGGPLAGQRHDDAGSTRPRPPPSHAPRTPAGLGDEAPPPCAGGRRGPDGPGPALHLDRRTGRPPVGIAEDRWPRRGAPPTDAEVVPYWRTLVERNRDRLADPDDPDLVTRARSSSCPGAATGLTAPPDHHVEVSAGAGPPRWPAGGRRG